MNLFFVWALSNLVFEWKRGRTSTVLFAERILAISIRSSKMIGSRIKQREVLLDFHSSSVISSLCCGGRIFILFIRVSQHVAR